jgi:hypothetical protein
MGATRAQILGDAEVAEIEWYFTVITMDNIDLRKK